MFFIFFFFFYFYFFTFFYFFFRFFIKKLGFSYIPDLRGEVREKKFEEELLCRLEGYYLLEDL
ncbi:MAG: hypothetical protein C0169_04590 [Thermodesulfobacterium geofontis]|uniref:Uncharacterized protein n=1 Tax=Thermodesulfobacterium geofontis TaxID=1295609 RepID=A0A2N7QCY0_9BACT|nr:MAG: hypothetical protein C0169_04590 [Thermodesulfobacterium geofontis]